MKTMNPLPSLRAAFGRVYAYTIHNLLPALYSALIGLLLTALLHHAGLGWLL
jgi:hypothetical protein